MISINKKNEWNCCGSLKSQASLAVEASKNHRGTLVLLFVMLCLHIHTLQRSRAVQIFCSLISQTPSWRLAHNVKVYQVVTPGTFDHVSAELQRSPEAIFMRKVVIFGALSTRSNVVPKLGTPLHFGPNSFSSLESGDPVKFWQPYWVGGSNICLSLPETEMVWRTSLWQRLPVQDWQWNSW